MISNLVFYQLGLIALVWVFLMLSGLWLSELTAARPQTPKPLRPPRTRSKEPKPFMGLTHKPYCEACAQGVESRREPPCAPPAPGRHLPAFLSRAQLSAPFTRPQKEGV